MHLNGQLKKKVGFFDCMGKFEYVFFILMCIFHSILKNTLIFCNIRKCNIRKSGKLLKTWQTVNIRDKIVKVERK